MKTAIVTGGSRGIGRASAIALAKRGFAVIINYAGSIKDAEDSAREIEATGGVHLEDFIDELEARARAK